MVPLQQPHLFQRFTRISEAKGLFLICFHFLSREPPLSAEQVAMTSSSTALCRDRMYITCQISDLPRSCCAGDLLVDFAHFAELDDCRKIVEDAATRADNVATDWVARDRDLPILLQCSEIFAVRSRNTGRFEAFVAIQPCLLTR